MKGWLKLLVLGAVPILAVTMVADQTLAADKGSQLIFRSNMAHVNFISIVNAHPDGDAVTVLVRYYNDEMKRVAWYLRVIPGGTNVLVDPFNHAIPGTAKQDDDDEDIPGSEKNVSDLLGSLPAWSNDDEGPGRNSGHFVIAVTAVAANSLMVAEGPAVGDGEPVPAIDPNGANTANILFPTSLAADMHGTGNIDNGGILSITGGGLGLTKFTAMQTPAEDDATTKNVGDLNTDNFEPIAFNHLTGHFTEAFVLPGMSGADQSASWGGSPIVRPAVEDTNNATLIGNDYQTLNGMNPATIGAIDNAGGRLAEKDAGGIEANGLEKTVAGYLNTGDNYGDGDDSLTDANADEDPMGGKIRNGERDHRVLNDGALVLPALHGAGDEIMLLLSVSENFGGPGKYELVPAMTGIDVVLMDGQGDPLDMKATSDPNAGVVGGGGSDPAAESASTSIIVNGIQVMVAADLAKCTGTPMEGPWRLSSLTSLIPEATAGGDKFAGLDAMIT